MNLENIENSLKNIEKIHIRTDQKKQVDSKNAD